MLLICQTVLLTDDIVTFCFFFILTLLKFLSCSETDRAVLFYSVGFLSGGGTVVHNLWLTLRSSGLFLKYRRLDFTTTGPNAEKQSGALASKF